MLAAHGYQPILLERGADVDQRTKDVEAFWENGQLNLSSNVQFGEGGAGTFSDGKLNTLVKDKFGRNHEVLRIFAEHGAPESITYESKPHIGTDVLSAVVKEMRKYICAHGGEVRFHSQVTDIQTHSDNGQKILRKLKIYDSQKKETYLLDTDLQFLPLVTVHGILFPCYISMAFQCSRRHLLLVYESSIRRK